MKKAITILIIVCLCVAVCISAGCILTPYAKPTQAPTKFPTQIPTYVPTIIPTQTPVPMSTFSTPTQTPVPMSTFSTPTQTPVPIATFSTPTQTPVRTSTDGYYKLNQLVNVSHGSMNFQTGVIDYMRGDKAYNTIHQGKSFVIVKPDPGNEFVFFEVYVKNNGTKELDLINISYTVYANGVEQSKRYPTLPDGYNTISLSKSILPGASTSGWYVYEVPIGSDVIIAYHTWLYDDEVYFKI